MSEIFTADDLKKSLKPFSARLIVDGVTMLSSKKDVGFTVAVSDENKMKESEAHFITANMRVIDHSETEGFRVEIEYYRPDLVTIEEVLTRFAEVLHRNAQPFFKQIENLLK